MDRKIRSSLLIGGLSILFCFVSTSFLHAEDTFEKKFWDFLIGNNYKQWSPTPNQGANFYSGKKPHGSLNKIYVNRIASGDINGLAQGSIIVLENYRSDRSLISISVMYRTRNYNPSGNDWYWVDFKPDGTVMKSDSGPSDATAVSTGAGKMSGRAASCIACHQQAGGGDLCFSNDSPGINTAKAPAVETTDVLTFK